MSIKQFHLLQLLLFIDRVSPKDIGDIATLRKLNGAAKELRSVIGKYEQEFIQKEESIRKSNSTEDERKKAVVAFQSWRKKNDNVELTFTFKNPEYAVTTKRIFEVHFKDHTFFVAEGDSENPILAIADLLGIKDE